MGRSSIWSQVCGRFVRGLEQDQELPEKSVAGVISLWTRSAGPSCVFEDGVKERGSGSTPAYRQAPRPEPFDGLKALRLIEGLGSKASPNL